MNIGILIPGFSDGERDWCIPVYLNLVRTHQLVRLKIWSSPHLEHVNFRFAIACRTTA